MGFWNKWPYTNFHEINLDWILDKVKQVYAAMSDFAVEWTKKLNIEAQARIDADDALRDLINTEATSRIEADKALQANLDTEAQARMDADNALRDMINTEAIARVNADTALQGQLNNLYNSMTAGDKALQDALNTETTARTEADDALRELISTETERATAAEEALGDRIDGIEGELDGITGAESPFIRKDGSTTTTRKIPLAMGGTSETDPTAETDLVNLRSMQAADEALESSMKEYVDNQLESAMGDIHSIPAGGTTGQVLSKVDDTDYNTKWIDPPSGSDPDAIKKDGTTVTTARIPFAKGIGLDSDNYWTENDFVSFTSGNNGRHTQIQNSNGNVAAMYATGPNGGPILNGVKVEPEGLQIMANGSNGTAGQVLTAQGDGTCRWGDNNEFRQVYSDSNFVVMSDGNIALLFTNQQIFFGPYTDTQLSLPWGNSNGYYGDEKFEINLDSKYMPKDYSSMMLVPAPTENNIRDEFNKRTVYVYDLGDKLIIDIKIMRITGNASSTSSESIYKGVLIGVWICS